MIDGFGALTYDTIVHQNDPKSCSLHLTQKNWLVWSKHPTKNLKIKIILTFSHFHWKIYFSNENKRKLR